MGLGMFYGAGNIERGMRERILERLRAQQAQQQMDLALRGATRADEELDLRRQEMAQRGEYQTAQLASINEARQAAADAANELRIGRKTGLMTPGQVLTGKDAEDLPSYLTQPEAQRELEAPPGIAAGEQGQPIAGTIASSPSIIGRRFVYTGTGPQKAEQSRSAYLKQLLENEPADSPMRRALEYRMGTGEQPPAGIFEKLPTSLEAMYTAAIQSGNQPEQNRILDLMKRQSEATRAPKDPADVTNLTPGGLDIAARMYATTGSMPPLGMGDKHTRQNIINRAAELYPGLNIAGNKATFAADQGSLAALQKQRDAVGAFEETALKNLNVFLAAAAKVPDLGSPVLNKPLRALTGQGLGSAELAAYETARRTVVPEFAKILSNPTLSGQLSDSARREIDHIIAGDATLAQIKSIIQVLKQDVENRRTSYDDSIKAIKGRLSGGTETETPAAPATGGFKVVGSRPK